MHDLRRGTRSLFTRTCRTVRIQRRDRGMRSRTWIARHSSDRKLKGRSTISGKSPRSPARLVLEVVEAASEVIESAARVIEPAAEIVGAAPEVIESAGIVI